MKGKAVRVHPAQVQGYEARFEHRVRFLRQPCLREIRFRVSVLRGSSCQNAGALVFSSLPSFVRLTFLDRSGSGCSRVLWPSKSDGQAVKPW